MRWLIALASLPLYANGAELSITGETSSITFNAYAHRERAVELVATNGQLNLSGVFLAEDVMVEGSKARACAT